MRKHTSKEIVDLDYDRGSQIFGRRRSVMSSYVPKKDYAIDLPTTAIDSDCDDDADIGQEIKAFMMAKNKAGRSDGRGGNAGKRPELGKEAARPGAAKVGSKERSKDGRQPLNIVSANLLVTDYDDNSQEDGVSIFKSCDYQSFGNYERPTAEAKRLKPKLSGISVETNVFQVFIPGKKNTRVCPHCDRSISKSPAPIKKDPGLGRLNVPLLKEKSHILRRSSKPSALTTKRSCLADLMGTPSNTKDSRSVSRSSIEKPGNYVKPGSRYKNNPAVRSRMDNQINNLIDSPIFKTMAEASMPDDLVELSRSYIMQSMAEKENNRGKTTKLTRIIPSFAKKPEEVLKTKGQVQSRNPSKPSYSSKLKR